MQEHPLQPSGSASKEVSAAATLIPYRRDDVRSKYLSYLCCGFSDEEALFVLGLNRKWVEYARQDGKFCELEERVPELRKELSKEYTEMDFYRNFRMVLEKDHRVLRTSLGMELVEDEETGEMVPVELTPFDQQYLLKLRSAYTPQQLQLLESVTKGNDGGFNFAEWVKGNPEIVKLSQTNSVTLARGGDGETSDNG